MLPEPVLVLHFSLLSFSELDRRLRLIGTEHVDLLEELHPGQVEIVRDDSEALLELSNHVYGVDLSAAVSLQVDCCSLKHIE